MTTRSARSASRPVSVAALLVLLSAAPILAAPGTVAPGAAMTGSTASALQAPERWRGVIDLTGVGGPEMEFFVSFSPGDSGYAATLSIPMQNATDLPLTEVLYSAERIEFTLMANPAVARFEADRAGDEATGVLLQGGGEFPIRMRLLGAGESAGPNRPQTPLPPFPYTAREVQYDNPGDGASLAGTLTVPPGPGPHPAAVLITGSGAQDRDETIFDHKPFAVIADALSRAGIAVLRSDDRGVGGSTAGSAPSTSSTFATDVAAAVAYLRAQPEIDPDRIGLIGHSEGGIIAPMVAAADERIAYIVMLAGTGVSGRELMPLQLAAVSRAAGVSEESIARQVAAQEAAFDLVIAGASDDGIRAAVAVLVDEQLAGASEAEREANRERGYEMAFRQVSSPWFRAFLIEDPRVNLRDVTCPVLALNGTRDTQVPAELNLEAIAEALQEAGNEDVETIALEDLNHLFQHAQTGGVGEYGVIEETFSPEALELIAAWIRARVGLGG